MYVGLECAISCKKNILYNYADKTRIQPSPWSKREMPGFSLMMHDAVRSYDVMYCCFRTQETVAFIKTKKRISQRKATPWYLWHQSNKFCNCLQPRIQPQFHKSLPIVHLLVGSYCQLTACKSRTRQTKKKGQVSDMPPETRYSCYIFYWKIMINMHEKQLLTEVSI